MLPVFQNTWAQHNTTLRTEWYTEEDGLSCNIVYDYAQDHNGFIWIGTAYGLNRFDGKNFISFKKNYTDTNSLLSNIIIRVAIDKKNRVWIGYKSGISCYDQVTRQFTHFRSDSLNPKSIGEGSIDELMIDDQNRVWIGVALKGLYMYDPAENAFTYFGSLPFVSKKRSVARQRHYNRLTQMLPGKDGKIYIGAGDGFYSFDTTSKKFEVFRIGPAEEDVNAWKKDDFSTICQLNDSSFYLGGWGTGVNYYNTRTGKWKTYLINPSQPELGTTNIINAIERKSDHEMWVSSNDTSLCIFNTRDEQFHYFSQNELSHARLNEKGIGALFTDGAGDLWMGNMYGVRFLNQGEPEFKYVPHIVSNSENKDYYGITWVYDDSISGSTFIATSFADGLNVIDKDGRISQHKIETMQGAERFLIILKIINDSRNNLWVLSRDYIYRFDRASNRLEKMLQPVPDSSCKGTPFFWDIQEAKDGKLWIATYRHGIYVFDPVSNSFSQLFNQPGNDQSLNSNTITGLGLDPDGNCWIGYKLNGVSCYNPVTGKFKHFVHNSADKNSLIDDQVLSMHADKKGNIWIGTFSGMSIVETLKKPHAINNFIKEQKLLGLMVVHVESDYDGNIWYTNTKGLSMYNPVTGDLKNYNYTNGLPFAFDAIIPQKGRDGEMILTTFAGYYRFRPETLARINRPGEVLITSITSGQNDVFFENELKNNGKVHLRASDNLFNISFISINYKSSSGLTYYFRLKGLDKSWKIITGSGSATYTHLQGGNYVFEVKAVNNIGMQSRITRIPIYVATPFYKTAWFTISVVLLITASIYALYRFRVRNIEKTESIKTQLNKQIAETEMRALRAQMNPHFIFNCLNSINRYIIKNDHKTASLYLTKFAKLIRLILDNSETHEISLAQELEALKLYVDIEALRFDHRFSYEIEVDEGMNTDSIMVPPMIVQPFVENAIWHGLLHKETPGKMYLRFMLQEDTLICEVEDNGVGREKAKEMKSKSATTRKSLGLKITADRLAILNSRSERQGGISFEDLVDTDQSPVGTRVTIRIPVDSD